MSITTSMEVMIQNRFSKFFEELKFQGIELNRDLIKDIEDLEADCIEFTTSQNSTEAEEWYENGYESGFENGRENGYDDGWDDGYTSAKEEVEE